MSLRTCRSPVARAWRIEAQKARSGHTGSSTNFTSTLRIHQHSSPQSNIEGHMAHISRPQHVDWRYLCQARARLGVAGSWQPSHSLSNINLPSQLPHFSSSTSASWFSRQASRYAQPSQALQRSKSHCFRQTVRRRLGIRVVASQWLIRPSCRTSSAVTG